MNLKCCFWAGIVFLTGMVFSCGGTVTKRGVSSASPNFEENEQDLVVQKDDFLYLKGSAKIQENDCPTCHALERKNVGPSYAAVAARYEDTEEVVAKLAGRIITGSTGIWGEIPMPPHPELSKEDAEQMVKFVLLLKK